MPESSPDPTACLCAAAKRWMAAFLPESRASRVVIYDDKGEPALDVRVSAATVATVRRTEPAQPLSPARHSSDSPPVHWYGTDYTFGGPLQRAIVRQLWEAWENGTPDTTQTPYWRMPVMT